MILKALIIFAILELALCTELVGHLERLGNQKKAEGHIDVLTQLPSPVEFFDKYIKPGRPAVFKGAAKPMPAFKNWDDEYLRTKYANLKFDIEEGKKENRSMPSYVYSMKDFVDKYKKEDVYMVHSIQKEMRGDVLLLPTISCGGYVNLLQDIVMWFSSGGTSSVLHSDGVDNINCLFSGNKELYMVNKKYHQFIDIDAPQGGHSNVNPQAVDLHKYPGLAKAPWWEAKMEAGDCLFIPVSWYHQVRSFDRNIAVNVWFTHPNHINKSDCEGKDWKSQYVPLNEFQLKSNKGAKQMLALEVQARGKMSKKEFGDFVLENLQVQSRQRRALFKLVDKNADNVITTEDIDGLSEKDLVMFRQLMPMGSDREEGDEEEDAPAGDSEGVPQEGGDVPPEGDDVGDGYDDSYDIGEPGVDKFNDNDFDTSSEDDGTMHTEL